MTVGGLGRPTETKHIKLNTKTQNIFYCINENLPTFLYPLTGVHENRRRKKVYFFKASNFNCYFKEIGF